MTGSASTKLDEEVETKETDGIAKRGVHIKRPCQDNLARLGEPTI
jgi:hypothetical protein